MNTYLITAAQDIGGSHTKDSVMILSQPTPIEALQGFLNHYLSKKASNPKLNPYTGTWASRAGSNNDLLKVTPVQKGYELQGTDILLLELNPTSFVLIGGEKTLGNASYCSNLTRIRLHENPKTSISLQGWPDGTY